MASIWVIRSVEDSIYYNLIMRIQAISVLTLITVGTALAGVVPPYKRGLTDHFISWLNDTAGYEPYGFNRSDFFGGSFGGK